jgi:YegS/Rv2252/BmrU family lipid kinase
MKIVFVANPFAGRETARALIEQIRAASPRLGCDVTVAVTNGPGDGLRLARELKSSADVLGVIGGDGTVHEVINGLMPDPIPIIILPAGTGNDFASLIAGPRTPDDVASIIGRGQGARLDVLDFDGRFCINSAGFGFEGLVNRRSHEITRVRGPALYLLAVFKTLASIAFPHFEIKTSDGRTLSGDKLLVSIGNGVRTGGGFYMTPKALPDDGLIDVCVVERMSRLKILRLLPKSMNGSHIESAAVETFRSEWVEIRTDPRFPMHIDGELVDNAPATVRITVRKRVLPVLCRTDKRNRLQHPVEKIL